MKFTPRSYQLGAIKHLCAPEAGRGLFLKPGLGKTSCTYAALTVLLSRGHAKGALIVAPLRPTYSVWPKEQTKWDEFRHLRVVNLHALDKVERARVVREGGFDIYLINYEGLAGWLVEQLEAQKAWPFDVLVVDESTKLKNTQTARFKALRPILPRFARRWILTGTPAPRGIEGLFGQVYVGDLGARLGNYLTHFRRRYFNEQPQRGGYSLWFVKPNAQSEVELLLKDFALTLDDKDHLNLQPFIVNDIEVQLPASARGVYDELEETFVAELAAGEITAVNAAAKAQKLRQIASGTVYSSEGVEVVHAAKVDALIDLIEEQSGEPLLVGVAFKHEVDAINAQLKKKFGFEAPYLGGGISAKASDEICERWNAGEIPVLLAHPTSVAHGLNLQAGGNALVWFTLTWSLEEYIQFIARVHRQGQKRQVTVHRIVAERTIDQRVANVLEAHDTVQTGFFNALKKVLL